MIWHLWDLIYLIEKRKQRQNPVPPGINDARNALHSHYVLCNPFWKKSGKKEH